jgi:hypothetical protein
MLMKKTFILFTFLFTSLLVNADFGYEIIPRLIDQSNYTYQISLLVYGQRGTVLIENRGEMDFGDGSTVIVKEIADSVIQLEEDWYVKYYTFQHTYPAPGSYEINYINYTRNMELNNFANFKTEEFKRINDVWIKLSHSIRDYTLTVVDEDGRVTAIDQEEPDYLIYPNPATDWLNFPVRVNKKIRIFDLHGKFISSHHSSAINVSHLKPGTYLLKYGQKTTRFVKK